MSTGHELKRYRLYIDLQQFKVAPFYYYPGWWKGEMRRERGRGRAGACSD